MHRCNIYLTVRCRYPIIPYSFLLNLNFKKYFCIFLFQSHLCRKSYIRKSYIILPKSSVTIVDSKFGQTLI